MASLALWLAGTRPASLPASVAPVLAGTAAAVVAGGAHPWIALGCGALALFLQIGVNFANDYSDGVRGSDDATRVGPQRLVGSGAARPGTVKAVAFTMFGIAAAIGLTLVAVTGHWWLIAVGAACILAAWLYTGGPRPYGYAALGEASVFVFFGLVAVCGTTFLQLARVTVPSLLWGITIGGLAAAILVTDNLRDRDGDAAVGKRTLATLLGNRRTRALYAALIGVPLALIGVSAALTSPWLLLGWAGIVPLVRGVRLVVTGTDGLALVPVLRLTGIGELLTGLGLLAGALLAGL